MTKVSVVIPTFNRAALLAAAVDSALAQSHKNIEIIVVDDGSTDDTRAVSENYGGRIVYLQQSNRGVNSARNAAIARATGEYIALLDSDDVYLPWAVQLLADVLDNFPQSGFAFADFLILRDHLEPRGPGLRNWHAPGFRWTDTFKARHQYRQLVTTDTPRAYRDDFDVYVGDIYGASLFGPQVPTSASIIRRSKMGDLRFPEFDSLCGDWEFFARLSHRHGAVYADVPVMLNRSHEDAVRLTRVDSATQLAARIDLVDRVWRQDGEFLAAHRADVDRRQFDLSIALARNRILAGDSDSAQEALKRAATACKGRQWGIWWAARIASVTPGAVALLRAARGARNRFWRQARDRQA